MPRILQIEKETQRQKLIAARNLVEEQARAEARYKKELDRNYRRTKIVKNPDGPFSEEYVYKNHLKNRNKTQ